MWQKIAFVVFLAATLLLTACSKDAEFNAFMTDFDKLTDDIVKKINDNPTSAGVDEAQKVLDGKKAEMKKKIDELKTARGFQVSEETLKKFEKSMIDNGNKIAKVMTDHAQVAVTDHDFLPKIQKLSADYTGMLQ